MATRCFHSSPPDSWTRPKTYSDEGSRYRKYGPIQPMQEDCRGERLIRIDIAALTGRQVMVYGADRAYP